MQENTIPVLERRTMSAEEFIEIVETNPLLPSNDLLKDWKGYVSPILKSTPIGQSKHNYVNITISQLKFNNVKIDEDLMIRPRKASLSNLMFSNCHISNITFHGVLANDIEFRSGSVVGDISVENGSKIGDILVQNSKVGNIQISNSKIENLQIQGISKGVWSLDNEFVAAVNDISKFISVVKNIGIMNSTAENIEIDNKSMTGSFNIFNSNVKNFRINNSKTGHFFIQENSTTGPFSIYNSVIAGDFRIENSKTEGFNIKDNSTVGNFYISKSSNGHLHILASIVGAIRVNNSTLSSVDIFSSKLPHLYLYQSSLPNIRIAENSFIGHFQCLLPLDNPAQISFDNSKVRHLDLDNTVFPEFTTMMVSGCKINILSADKFCNYGSIFFSNLKSLEEWEDFKKHEGIPDRSVEGAYEFEIVKSDPPFSIIRLTDSDLGKTQFINCDLTQFHRFEFSNTKMLDVFVAGSQMPSDNAFCMPDDEKNFLKIAEQKRLAYGQFKKIYESQGDTAHSLRYLAFEMEAYREQIQINGWWKNWGELFMLWMNRISTYYGTSWQRGLLVTLLAMIFFFSIFCYLIGYRFQNDSPDDIDRFCKLVSYAPYYLNPLRDLDSVSLIKEENFTPSARSWDFISRIFVAYFVYQTIQAFRKLGKSSG